MANKLRILYATQEITPFLKLSDSADFLRLLPQGLQEKGHEIRILMPQFGVINERRNRLHEVVRLSGINIRVGNEEKPLTIKVATIPNARLQVYFLYNEDYFQRKSILNDPKDDTFHQDNDERSIFFCKGVIETVKKLGWQPDIIHCHGWMTGLIPLYLKTHFKDDELFQSAKVVYSVYDDSPNFPLPENFAEKAMLDKVPEDLRKAYASDTFWGFNKGGALLADTAVYGGGVGERMTQLAEDEGQNGNFRPMPIDEPKQAVDAYNDLYLDIAN